MELELHIPSERATGLAGAGRGKDVRDSERRRHDDVVAHVEGGDTERESARARERERESERERRHDDFVYEVIQHGRAGIY